jgi:hypothetical protein
MLQQIRVLGFGSWVNRQFAAWTVHSKNIRALALAASGADQVAVSFEEVVRPQRVP